ncbi:MAG: tetratricopeptide repeat protein [Spirochaetales bacterium]|nr:tetratricopeptide repeat protein [Spirochaetales bacterium]
MAPRFRVPSPPRAFGLISGIALIFSVILGLTGCMSAKTRRELAAEYFHIGPSFFELKNYDKALAMYEKALSYHDEFSETSYNLARLYISRSRYPDAIRVLEELLGRDPDNLVLLQTLAYAHAKNQEPQAAIATYTRILAISEGSVVTLYNLSVLYEEADRREEAMSTLKSALRLAPDDADVLRRLGYLEAEHGSGEEAAEYLKAYMDIKTDDAATAVFLTELYKKQRLYAEALSFVEGFITRTPNNAGILFEHAWLLITQAEEKPRGMEVLGKALEAGFTDKEKAASLLLACPDSALREVENYLVEKKILTEEEAKKAIEGAFKPKT